MTLALLAPLAAAAEAIFDRADPKPEPEVLARIKDAERLAAEKALVATFHPDYLDARPVIWSLYTHPEQWSVHDPYYLYHSPSGHYISEAAMRAVANCSCHEAYFQGSQRDELMRAGQWFRGGDRSSPPDYAAPTIRAGRHADQFAGHFIR